MPTDNKEVAIRKRQQIDSSKKTMFIFVASSAFLAGIALVVSVFLIQQVIFHTKIIAEKQTTIGRLDKNIRNIGELKKNVRVLETNTALNSVKSSKDSSALQTILDALPDNANADALGASIKEKFIDSTNGIEINNLSITQPGKLSDEGVGSSGQLPSGNQNVVAFSAQITGPSEKMKELLTKFEKSIRVIELISFEIQAAGGNVSLVVQGVAYYEPAQTVQLEKKVVKL